MLVFYLFSKLTTSGVLSTISRVSAQTHFKKINTITWHNTSFTKWTYSESRRIFYQKGSFLRNFILTGSHTRGDVNISTRCESLQLLKTRCEV